MNKSNVDVWGRLFDDRKRKDRMITYLAEMKALQMERESEIRSQTAVRIVQKSRQPDTRILAKAQARRQHRIMERTFDLFYISLDISRARCIVSGAESADLGNVGYYSATVGLFGHASVVAVISCEQAIGGCKPARGSIYTTTGCVGCGGRVPEPSGDLQGVSHASSRDFEKVATRGVPVRASNRQ